MYQGIIHKMSSEYLNPIQYQFLVGDHRISMNQLINKKISLKWNGKVECICGRISNKFYRQQFCYQCYWNAPEASPSIFKPELCTADLGVEERDLEWEKAFQLKPHYVYLSNSSGLKVGITRKNNELTRWIDQGAVQGIVVAEVPNRRLSGLIEVELKKVISDRTNWRKMLSGDPSFIDLDEKKSEYLENVPNEFSQFLLSDNKVVEINYPVLVYPKKIASINFKKTNPIEGKLLGIKGQYLIFDNDRVFNVRSHQGYCVEFSY
tara:strand:- start:7634 stop:8425 length:792 start_codon:yes stop_codon:yes gene_type:complete